jgi:uncharacterized protein
MARLEMGSGETAALGATADALFALGLLYSNGHGVGRDFVAAHKWFNLAAARGNATARTYRSEIAREMSAEEIAEAQRQARAWLGLC